MRVEEQLISVGYTVTVLLRAYVDEDLTASEYRQRARDLIHEHRADVLARVTFQTSISYDVMIWSQGYMRGEYYHDETVAEARARVRGRAGKRCGLRMEEESEAVGRVRKRVKEPLLNQVKKLGNKLREIWSCQDEDEDESVRAFGMRFQKISDVLMKKGKISEVECCTIFIGHLSKGRQNSILRDLPRDRLDFPEVLKLTIKAEAEDYKDLVWRGMRRRDFSLYKEYATDRCPDFKDYPWSEKNEAVAEEVKEIRDMGKGLTGQVTEIVTTTGVTTYRDKPGGPYSLRWDRRNNDPWRSVEDRNPRTLTDYRTRGRERDNEPWRRWDDEIDRDRRDRVPFVRARRLDDYPRSPRYEADRGRGDSRSRWETDQGRRDGYRDDRYERSA
ncbi:hypothetical protein CBR_g44452 [Chara braunii]|uniref:Uncharacterized protein n=1 Tax=Chara braunii TaxID=69332 RepID=A0A388LXF3_CHABU|nr:hypothetical protein CBR_g44452 [Chara braunii]|eukprot:GBG86997.1 hypothetical protein CBR_g44452 [Chara braunii]